MLKVSGLHWTSTYGIASNIPQIILLKNAIFISRYTRYMCDLLFTKNTPMACFISRKTNVKQIPMPNRHQFCLTKPCHVSRSYHETRQNPCFFLKNTRDWIFRLPEKPPSWIVSGSPIISHILLLLEFEGSERSFPLNKSYLSIIHSLTFLPLKNEISSHGLKKPPKM